MDLVLLIASWLEAAFLVQPTSASDKTNATATTANQFFLISSSFLSSLKYFT